MMWQVFIVYNDGEIEKDKLCDNRIEAEQRALQVGNYFSMFGGTSMILPCKANKKLVEKEKIEHRA